MTRHTRREFLRAAGCGGALLAASSAGRLLGAGAAGGKAPPNLVMVLADDQTWFDANCYGNPTVRTPHMDRLAAQGMRFELAFTATAMCVPSRSTLYSGLYPMRHGAHANHSRAKDGIRSLPHFLKPLGYDVTVAGKTHFGPKACFPIDGQIGLQPAAIEKHIERCKGRPFCLMVCSHSPHVPWEMKGDYQPAAVRLPPYFADTPEVRQAMCYYYNEITEVDGLLGTVSDLLAKHGLADNTVLIYSSDQGAQWPHAKWTLYDAGIQVPLIVRWPGVVKPGSVSSAMIHFVDVLPTFIEVAGGRPPEGLDGRSFLPVLRGKTEQHRDVIYATTTRDGTMNDYPGRAVRTRQYKYIRNLAPEREYTTHLTHADLDAVAGRNPVQKTFWDSWRAKAKTDPAVAAFLQADARRPAEELYDLGKDPHELHNLSDKPEMKQVLADLRGKLDAWMKAQNDHGLAAEWQPLAPPAPGGQAKKKKARGQ